MHGLYDEPDPASPGPLAGLRVVDLTRARAGPTCVRQLADLGADVIALRAPDGAGAFAPLGSDGANLQRNKRSMVIDLTTDAGHDVFLRLVAQADVVVENFRPAVKTRLRVDPNSVWAVNPRVIYASISGFGQTGPYAEHPGVDQIAQGLGGLMSVTGPAGTGPSRVGIAISDTASGTFLTLGVLAALVARERTGRGQWVHTSLLESMVNLMDFQAMRWLVDGEVPAQTGNHHPTLTPMGTFPTADGWINVAPAGDFGAFCDAVGAPELATDARYATRELRVVNRGPLEAAIGDVLQTRPTSDWLRALEGLVPCGPVLALDEVFADPQVRHLHLTRAVTGERGDDIEVLRVPLTFSDTPTSVRSGPPADGAHTREVLAELGYDRGEIDALAAAGVVRMEEEPRR